jgi:hypothetical protein
LRCQALRVRVDGASGHAIFVELCHCLYGWLAESWRSIADSACCWWNAGVGVVVSGVAGRRALVRRLGEMCARVWIAASFTCITGGYKTKQPQTTSAISITSLRCIMETCVKSNKLISFQGQARSTVHTTTSSSIQASPPGP